VSRTYTVGKKTYTALFPDLLPPLTPEARAGLKDDIAKHGVLVPVIVDEHNGIIDGIHRLEIAAELGCQVSVEVRRGMSPEEKRDLALSLNVHRRHLTPEELQRLRQERIARVAEGRRQGKSIRTLAAEEKVSPGQVHRDVAAATVSGETVEPEGGRVTGRDGRRRPAARQKRESPPATAPVLPAARDEEEPRAPTRKRPYIAIERATEAIECLKRIPRNDGFREEAFWEVRKFVERSRRSTPLDHEGIDQVRALRMIKDCIQVLEKPKARGATALVLESLLEIQQMLERRPPSWLAVADEAMLSKLADRMPHNDVDLGRAVQDVAPKQQMACYCSERTDDEDTYFVLRGLSARLLARRYVADRMAALGKSGVIEVRGTGRIEITGSGDDHCYRLLPVGQDEPPAPAKPKGRRKGE
jgi:hypothetical protein